MNILKAAAIDPEQTEANHRTFHEALEQSEERKVEAGKKPKRLPVKLVLEPEK